MMNEIRNYKNHFVLITLVLLLVSACSNPAAAGIMPASLPTDTSLPAASTATQTEALSPVPPPTTSIPQPTITPASLVGVEPHPLALDENAVAFDMELLRRIGTGEPNDVLWSPDGDYFAVATSRGIYLYDGQTYEEIHFIDMGKNVVSMAFSPDSRELALGFDGTVGVWNVASGQQISAMQGGFEDRIGKIVYGVGGHIAAYGDNCRGCGDPSGQAVSVWDGHSGEQLYFRDDLFIHSDAIDISHNGDTLLYYRGGIGFLDLIDRKNISSIEDAPEFPDFFAYELLIAPNDEHFFVSRSPWYGDPENYLVPLNGDSLVEVLLGEDCWEAKKNGVYAICHGEQSVIVFSLLDGEEIMKLEGIAPVYSAAINPTGDRIAVIHSDSVLVIDTDTEKIDKTFDYIIFDEIDAAITSNGRLREYIAATTQRNGIVTFWDLVTGEMRVSIKVSNERFRSLDFSPDQSTLATIDDLSIIRLVDINTSSKTRTYDLDDLVSGQFLFNPNGLELAFLYGDPLDIYALNLQNEELGQKRQGNSIYKFFYSNDGSLISWTWGKDFLTLVNLDRNITIRFPYDLVSGDATPEVMALSPDGRFVVFGLDRSAILVGETEKLEIINELDGHDIRGGDGGFGSFRDMKFGPTSNVLVSVGSDRTTRLWNVESGIELKTLDICCYADFTADGRFLVTAGNSVIEVWGVPPLP